MEVAIKYDKPSQPNLKKSNWCKHRNKIIFVFSFFQGVKITEIFSKLSVCNNVGKIAKTQIKNL